MKKLNIIPCSKIYFKVISNLYDKQAGKEEFDILPIYEETHEIAHELYTLLGGCFFKVLDCYIDYVSICIVYFKGYKYGIIISDSEQCDKIDVEICCLGVV